ncbi:MAG: ArsR/SmtB family transcription factor [Candidatus Asgardarchaeia archaeon]
MSDISEQIKKLEEELRKLKERLREMEIEKTQSKTSVEVPVKIPIISEEELPTRRVSKRLDSSILENEIIRDVQSIFKKSLYERAAKLLPISKLVDNLDPVEASKMLSALANDVRLLILKLLFYQGRYFSELEEITGLNPSPLNFHLAKLMEVGLIKQERSRGRYIITNAGQVVIILISYLWKRLKEAKPYEL